MPKGLKLPPLRVLTDEQAASLPRDRRDELQAKSLAAFTWRSLEALRAAWAAIIPGGRVEAVMYDRGRKCGYLMGRAHVEVLPFPWPSDRVWFYFYTPGIVWPAPMMATNSERAVDDDRVSVRPEWVTSCIDSVLTTLGGSSCSGPG